jgi:EAL domain-containing protein (putative c-di-GMP-specific phosphodiesterase class I)
VDLATGAVVDHELLIRLRGADGGLIAPGAFLPAAERFELMGDIDAWVLEQAVAHAASGRSVHLNVSAQSIGDACVVGALGRALAETGADGRLLTLELTETALVRDGRRAARFALSARAFGCRVALDDFGSGYNGFARIKQLSVDILKIDQLFVRDLLQSPASQSVVKAIVSLARDLGIRTVGEGVEDAATLERLRELGVDQAQGYHLGRPAELPAC